MSAKKLALHGWVTDVLAGEAADLTVMNDGSLSLRRGSARVFVTAQEHDDRTLIVLRSPVVVGASPDPQLFEHVATHAGDYYFGHLSCTRRDGAVDVYLSHTLLGDHLQPDELINSVVAVLTTANEIDDLLARKFGGTVFHAT